MDKLTFERRKAFLLKLGDICNKVSGYTVVALTPPKSPVDAAAQQTTLDQIQSQVADLALELAAEVIPDSINLN